MEEVLEQGCKVLTQVRVSVSVSAGLLLMRWLGLWLLLSKLREGSEIRVDLVRERHKLLQIEHFRTLCFIDSGLLIKTRLLTKHKV